MDTTVPIEQLVAAVDQLAVRVQQVADRAVPAARKLATVIRIGAIAGLIGGTAGAAALSMPGVGFVSSWPFFVLLVLIAIGCALIVLRWGTVLRDWSGDIRGAVAKLSDIPAPAEVVARVRATTQELVPVSVGAGDRSAIVALLKVAAQLRRKWRDVPQLAGKAKDVSLQLTGPFRPPMVAIRFTLLLGGLAMVVVGPLLLLIAIAT
jgi:hypothetical protein